MSDTIMEVNDGTFTSEVEGAEQPVIVDFWAPWCTPCRVMDPILDELAEQHQGRIKFTKVNVDENQGIADRFQVLSIPTLILFKGGQPVVRITGFQPKERIANQLKPHLA